MKILFVTTVGSHLYRLNTENSDLDFKGFAFPEIDEILGLNSFEQQQYNNNVEDGPEKKEGQIYSVKKFLNLAINKCNPTILEVCFADEKYHMFSTPIGKEICDFIKENGISKQLFKAYSAYHRAQMKKLQSITRTGKRKEIVDEYGYDIKFASHAYRLGVQACYAMKYGEIKPTLDGKELEIAKNFRKGSYSKEEAIKILETVDKNMYNEYTNSDIREKPDFKKSNDYLVNLYKKYINGEYDSQFKEWQQF